MLHAQRRLGLAEHGVQLVVVVAVLHHIVGDDQLVLGVDDDLDVVPRCLVAALVQQAGVRVGHRTVRLARRLQGLQFGLLGLLQRLHGLQLLQLGGQLGVPRGRFQVFAVRHVQSFEPFANPLLQSLDVLGQPLHATEAFVTDIAVEVAAVHPHALAAQQAQLLAEPDEPGMGLAQGLGVALAEIGNRLVAGPQALHQPDHLQVALAVLLKGTAAAHPIDVAVQVQLQQIRWRKRRLARLRPVRRCPVETQRHEIQRFHVGIDGPHWIVGVHVVVQPGRQTGHCLAVRSLFVPSNHRRFMVVD